MGFPNDAHHYKPLPQPPTHKLRLPTDMSTVPTDVSDWIPTAATLNDRKCGENARFSGDNSIVERRDPKRNDRDCVCYTSLPLPVGQVWQTTVLDTIITTRGWGLVSGYVPCLQCHMLCYYITSEHSTASHV